MEMSLQIKHLKLVSFVITSGQVPWALFLSSKMAELITIIPVLVCLCLSVCLYLLATDLIDNC